MPTHISVLFVAYDAKRIGEITRELAEQLGVSNPISIEVDETTPLSKMSATIEGPASPDSTILLKLQSGALEDTKHLTNFSEKRARLSLGRVMLRAVDRLRADFADAPADLQLTNSQNAAWDVYCYDFRNRFGFHDDIDVMFDRLWSAEDLGWADLPIAG
jgi:hypothetical protein